MCNQEHFATVGVVSSQAPKPAPRKSHIKPFETTSGDRDLRTALREWRDAQALIKYGSSTCRTYGSKLLMSDEIVSRIVECAHAHKLGTLANLRKETHWRNDFVDEYGPSILALVQAHHPISAPSVPSEPSTSLPGEAAPTSGVVPSAPAANRKRRPPTCSRCRQVGHNSTWTHCLAISVAYICS